MSCRRRPSRTAKVSRLALLTLCVGSASNLDAAPNPVASAAGNAETLVLSANVDGARADDPIIVHRRGAVLSASAADLRAIGIPARQSGEVLLSQVTGLRWTIDASAQTIDFTVAAPPSTHVLRDTAVHERPAEPITPAGWGGIVSYDANVMDAAGDAQAAAFVDATLYTPFGYGFASGLSSVGSHRGQNKLNRLATGFTIADPATMRRLVVGDYISTATTFGQSIRLAGFQYSTDFSLRPDLVTFPLPSVSGSAAVPSAVDLILNGARQAVGQVKAGQFAVADVPVRSDLNTITVAVRDALGREMLRTVSTYASRDLLRPGLSAVALEAGAVRIGYGTDNDRYGDLALSGSYRRGLTNWWTIEAHGEAVHTLASASLGATLSLGALGQLDLSAGASNSHAGTGLQAGVGFERIGRRTSITARYTYSSRQWLDLASRYGAVVHDHSLIVNVGFDLGRFGTASASLLDLGRSRSYAPFYYIRGPLDDGVRSPTIARTTLLTANYSVRIRRRLNVLATGGADLRHARSAFATIGVLAVFGNRTTGFVGANVRSGDAGASMELTSNAVLPGQFGYRLTAAEGAVDRLAGGIEHQGSRGHYAIDAEQANGQIAVRASARGAIVVSGDGVFAADDAPNSVAIVDTGGQPGVKVYRDNRLAGVSDRHGKLVVTNLNPFQPTKLSIDPEQLSDDFMLPIDQIVVRPPERSGVRVRFNLRRSSALLIRLIGDDGNPIAAGSRASLGGDDDLPVGIGGEVFVTSFGRWNRLTVTDPNGRRCVTTFGAPAVAKAYSMLGPLRCTGMAVASK